MHCLHLVTLFVLYLFCFQQELFTVKQLSTCAVVSIGVLCCFKPEPRPFHILFFQVLQLGELVKQFGKLEHPRRLTRQK